jgi:hypothetical protein
MCWPIVVHFFSLFVNFFRDFFKTWKRYEFEQFQNLIFFQILTIFDSIKYWINRIFKSSQFSNLNKFKFEQNFWTYNFFWIGTKVQNLNKKKQENPAENQQNDKKPKNSLKTTKTKKTTANGPALYTRAAGVQHCCTQSAWNRIQPFMAGCGQAKCDHSAWPVHAYQASPILLPTSEERYKCFRNDHLALATKEKGVTRLCASAMIIQSCAVLFDSAKGVTASP